MILAKYLLKRQKINRSHLTAAIIITFAAALRLCLVLLHWPPTNSDEGTMVIMANNIAYHGEWPLNFYHQAYMGSLEAYLGAILFRLTGGQSITALRIGVIFLTTLFLISIYNLSRLVFSKQLALVTLALLSFGSIPYLTRQTIATGGSTQTLLFGTLAFLLAFQLARTRQQPLTPRKQWLRYLGYAAFGLDVGVGIWSDMVILPCVVLATVLLITFCWRELVRKGGWLIVLLSALVGFLPCLIYNAQQGTNPVITLFNLIHGTGSQAPTDVIGLWQNIVNTIQISLPTATSLPFCPVLEYPFLGDNTLPSLHCTIIHTTWGIGYLLLTGTTLLATGTPLWYMYRQRKHGQPSAPSQTQEDTQKEHQSPENTDEEREWYQIRVRLTTQCLLAAMVLGTLLIYIPSSGPVDQPGYHARYLIGLLIATPAVIAPLWNSASMLTSPLTSGFTWPSIRWQTIRMLGSRITLIMLLLMLITGTVRAFLEIPQAHAQEQLHTDIAHRLESLKVTRFYADYWLCYNLMIETHDKLICSVIDSELSPNHERYKAGREIVNDTRHTSWICAKDLKLTMPEYNCLPALEAMMKKIPSYEFHRYEFDGYVLYKNTQPEAPKHP